MFKKIKSKLFFYKNKLNIKKSNLFDSEYYLKYYKVDKHIKNPLKHFILYGLENNYKPNEEFDPIWYKEFYSDIKKADIYSFIHFIMFGLKENRFQNKNELEEYQTLKEKGFDIKFYQNSYKDLQKQQQNFDFILHYIRYGKKENRNIKFKKNSVCLFGEIIHTPLISIIAVNFNGANDLPTFLNSLSEQSYTNFELLIVDNNSKDNSKQIIEKEKNVFKSLQFLNTGKNLGFAEGNNFALPYCKGELIALLNIDTKVDKNWLKELVNAISKDPSVAAVTSKTLFYEKFQDLELKSNQEFSLQLSTLVSTMKYKKYFIRKGNIRDDKIISEDNTIIISLPIQNETMQLIINIESINTYLSLKKGEKDNLLIKLKDKEINIKLDFSKDSVGKSSYIINNAGSTTINNMPADRGIGEYDKGQYDTKCYVDFVCGVSVLLRRSAIVNREIFVPEFFAYYEDSELSRWLREKGYNILYTPKSILYHKHSQTSSEGSNLWTLLVNRSKAIYQHCYITKQTHKELFNKLEKYEEYFKYEVNQEVYTQLKKFTKNLIKRLETTNDIVKYKKSIAIYNTYWNTKGGGESHALAFATFLQNYAPVYLISEYDFSIDELSEYYNLNLDNCYKLIETNITSDFTKKFDLFINSTYRSNLISKAKKSYYIVSFPHKEITSTVLKSYTFLYNSDYTEKWAKIYWGDKHKSDIIYPIGMVKIPKSFTQNKEKLIISVGRFFIGEHSKNQHIIAKAFKTFIQSNPSYREWKLILIGSLNENNKDDILYVQKIKKILNNINSEIIINAPREILQTYYEKSSIYIHASGYGKDTYTEPEKFEHFGITPVEAMINGCYPIVYKIGGPAELIKKLTIGHIFNTQDELVFELEKALQNINKNTPNQIRKIILDFIKNNNFKKKLQKIEIF